MAVTTCDLMETRVQSLSKAGMEVVATWIVEIDQEATAQNVIALCQESGISGSPVGGVVVPKIDDIYSLRNKTDESVQCDTLQARHALEGAAGKLKWVITATYRSPQLRAVAVDPDINIEPTQRQARFKVETRYIVKDRDRGRNCTKIRWPYKPDQGFGAQRFEGAAAERAIGEDGPITNAAGFRYGPLPQELVQLPTFVYRRAVTDPFAFLSIVNDFRGTVNKGDWDIFGTGQKASEKRCRFQSIEISEPLFWGDQLYYEIECRVEYDPEGHKVKVRNEGAQVWVDLADQRNANGERLVDPDGLPIVTTSWILDQPLINGHPMQPPLPMNEDGMLAAWSNRGNLLPDDPDDLFIEFEDHEEKVYATLTSRLENLA